MDAFVVSEMFLIAGMPVSIGHCCVDYLCATLETRFT